MRAHLSKQDAIALVCYLRQAERSVHHALACRSQWAGFLAYYDEPKRNYIARIVALLHEAGAPCVDLAKRPWQKQSTFVEIVSGLGKLVANRFRTVWSFSAVELSFFHSTLAQLLEILENPDPPENKILVDLRMDLFECQWVIQRKMLGVAELSRADRIEHFLHSEHLEHVTLEEMKVHASWQCKGPELSKRQ